MTAWARNQVVKLHNRVDVIVVEVLLHSLQCVCRTGSDLCNVAAESTDMWTLPASNRVHIIYTFLVRPAVMLCGTISTLAGYISQVCCNT